MTLHSTTKIFMTAFAVSTTLGLTTNVALSQTQQPAPSSGATTFLCASVGSGYATVAKRGERTTPPLITWNSKEFGSKYKPEERCKIVSQRLTQAVSANGGKLKNLLLTYGPVNGAPVICHVSSTKGACNSQNLLFTLRSQDRGKERQILEQLINFSVLGSGNPIAQSGELPGYAKFGERVEQSLTAQGVVNSPNPDKPTQEPMSKPSNTGTQQPTPVNPTNTNTQQSTPVKPTSGTQQPTSSQDNSI